MPRDIRHTKVAMVKGHSKILINENVILENDAHCETAALDMIMMAIFGSAERTKLSWHKL
jgi:hypothetical protein